MPAITHEKMLALVEGCAPIMAALKAVRDHGPNGAWVGGGAIRNLIWDYLENKPFTPPVDIDVIYYDTSDITKEAEKWWDAKLEAAHSEVWSCKNQARMHELYDLPQAKSVAEGMTRWVYKNCAIAARLDDKGQVELMNPFGAPEKFAGLALQPTPFMAENHTEFTNNHYMDKGWHKKWPNLTLA